MRGVRIFNIGSFLLFLVVLPLFTFGQVNDSIHSLEKKHGNENSVLMKLSELGESGVEFSQDSIYAGEEFQKILSDSLYRDLLFPKTYTWEQTKFFIQTLELKKAFWYLINLYPESKTNKELVLKTVLTYDKLYKMDEILINTFYTYSFLDIEVCDLNGEKPEIKRPDIQEAKLNSVKEIIAYIYHFRDQNKEKEKKDNP